MKAVKSTTRQRGVGLTNLLTWAFLLVFIAIGIMKVIPVYVQDRTIQHALDQIAHNPDMQEAQVRDIQDAFFKQATMDAITVVSEKDIVVDKRSTGLVLSVNYQVKVPLMGNASLLFDFNTSSAAPRR